MVNLAKSANHGGTFDLEEQSEPSVSRGNASMILYYRAGLDADFKSGQMIGGEIIRLAPIASRLHRTSVQRQVSVGRQFKIGAQSYLLLSVLKNRHTSSQKRQKSLFQANVS
ncbi:hypothetical protein Tco_0693162 [Tanacetum coccineum]